MVSKDHLQVGQTPILVPQHCHINHDSGLLPITTVKENTLSPSWEALTDCLSFATSEKIISSHRYIEATSHVLDVNLFINCNDATIIDKFRGNEFITHNITYFLERFSEPHKLIELYDLSNFMVNTLCKSVLVKNNYDYIMEMSPGYKFDRLGQKLDELYVQYHEDAYSPHVVQDIATPDSKLYYPEPFIASPSFNHEEIWFIHILHYNYWLWFFFISLIMFYFITFINVVRWCNLRAKPKRETRGVSRSKCADLITACVPVSWAISIIISETVDATDYYDGFGTGEIVIGIRAYQWGWEYFYPKNIDLNYNVKPSYSSFLGNSIKYNNTGSSNLDANILWKYYQKKNGSAQLNSPIHLLLSPNDNFNSLNTIDFSSVGNAVSKDSNAFKKIQKFSKITTNNSIKDFSDNSQVFTKINNLYNNSNALGHNAYFYGTRRQHDHSSLESFLPSFSTLVDKNGLDKFYEYTLHNKKPNEKPLQNFANQLAMTTVFNHSEEKKSFVNGSSMLTFIRVLSQVGRQTDPYLFKWILNFYNNYNIENISDTKSTFSPFRPAFKHKAFDKKYTPDFTKSKNILDDLLVSAKDDFYSWNLFNSSRSYRFKDLNSSNLSFLTTDKNPRLILKKKNWRVTRDITSATDMGLIQNNNLKITSNIYNNYKNSSIKWISPELYTKLVASKTVSSSHGRSPVISSNNLIRSESFDRLPKYFDDETSLLFKGKEDSAPTYIFSTYWSSFWKNINLEHNYNFIINNYEKLRFSYMPSVVEYSEYDFRNWQALESLEDAIWESSHSAFLHDDYVSIKKNSLESQLFAKPENKYHSLNRYDEKAEYRFKNTMAYKSFLNTSRFSKNYLALNIFNDDFFLKPASINLNNFLYYNNFISTESIEESYENIKNLKSIYFKDYKNLTFLKSNFTGPVSYTTVLDPFRSDFEENNWLVDSEFSLTNTNYLNNHNNFGLTNSIKLRPTAKNLIVTYSAIQKVYKSRFDELRSNINFNDFTNSFIKYPFITEKKTPYENMLFKNENLFFNTNLYNTTFKNSYSMITELTNPTNSVFLDIPFLLSMKSDASRYMWFDWHARWSSIEVQPSSIARYSLAGLPYFSKKFEYSSLASEELNESENYLTKVTKARKNYMPNWAYSLYFYSKVSNWFFNKNYNFVLNEYSTPGSKYLLKNSRSYWKKYDISSNKTLVATPSYSGLNAPNKVTWSPIKDLAAHYYNVSILIDILSKREYIYRRFLSSKVGIHQLHKSFTVSPQSTILKEIQSAYRFIDPTTYSSEVTREILYQNNKFLHFTFLRDFIYTYNSLNFNFPINTSLLSNYYYQLFGYNSDNLSFQKNNDLYKSQYRPMKKSVTNMIRLQATNAIAMPTEIRLHLLASSKDVIHSWAIPSAGIKIDCVPGYSSHRIAIFLTHGIFWGQCMEICGRYHHWMPIVVYFMKRDLFFLWCTHFMHYSDIDQTFNMNDKQLIDYLRLVSFDKTSWVNEINKSFL